MTPRKPPAKRGPQSGILSPAPVAGHHLELDLAGDGPVAALERLAKVLPPRAVVGFGAPLVRALGLDVPGLRPFTAIHGGASFPASQRALWLFLPGASPGEAFQRAEVAANVLAPAFRVVTARGVYKYREGRDLSGYVDGTENPKGRKAAKAAIVEVAPRAGGGGPVGSSFALVQRFVHGYADFHSLPGPIRDATIGRAMADDRELTDSPADSHVKRTAQESFDPPAILVRRSLPWGDLLHHGLLFVAFVADLSRIDAMLRRMAGLEDGIPDALMKYTTPETGAYYWVPPGVGGRFDVGSLGLR